MTVVPRTFVSVAAYRDPELVPTVADCLAKARHPEALRFGICWQHGDDQRLPDWIGGDQFEVLDVDWRDSRGVCWARTELMQLWDGEDRYLQLDSHHRFADEWDVRLERQLSLIGEDRALLSAYAAAYTPGVPDPEPWVTQIGFDHFDPDGALLTRPWIVTDPEPVPIPARFVSAHLLYAPGRFVRDVPYDPELYFIGEEATLAVRAFTHGYELYHPGEHIAWHEYTRVGRAKHWDDHVPARVGSPAWDARDRISRAKVTRLLHSPWLGKLGLGRERTLADYERYAGVCFRERRVLGEPVSPVAPPASASPATLAAATDRPRRARSGQPSIFVAIAAYRDSELEATVADCLRTAAHPQALRFGICRQHGPNEPLPTSLRDSRIRLVDVGWRHSHGASWARAQAIRGYDGEEWYLQLDSHHRFTRRWDETLLAQARRSGRARPVLSAPLPAYAVGSAPAPAEPWRVDLDGFGTDGLPVTAIGRLFDSESADTGHADPVPARCICAHLLFAPGEFVVDVGADPELYLSGEEIITSVRAFMRGYELLHPSRVIAWHAYDRSHRVCHWQDHGAERNVPRDWRELRRLGLRHYFGQLARARVGAGAFAGPRTLADYEAYAGISFQHRRVQDDTRCHRPPPNPPVDPAWPRRVHRRRIEIAVSRGALAGAAVDDPAFWYVGVHAADGRELLRRDATPAELSPLLRNGARSIRLTREVESEATPATWTVIPFSASRGWTDPIVGEVGQPQLAGVA